MQYWQMSYLTLRLIYFSLIGQQTKLPSQASRTISAEILRLCFWIKQFLQISPQCIDWRLALRDQVRAVSILLRRPICG